MLFPYGSQDTLAAVTSIGYALFIFTTGVQMDLSMVTRTGQKAWTIAITGLVAPLLICFPTMAHLFEPIDYYLGEQSEELFTVVVAHTVISFAVVASLLNELKILNSELGRLALSSVLVSDIVGATIASLSRTFTTNEGEGLREILVAFVALIALVIFVPLVCRPTMFWVIKHTKEGRPVDDAYIYVIIVMVFALGWVAVKIKQDFILGAFVLGLAVPEGPPLGSALVKKLQFFGQYLFLPIFVTCGVMKAEFSWEHSYKALGIAAFIGITHLIKIIACLIPTLLCKIPLKDALALSLILNAKGVVDVGFFGGLYDEMVLIILTLSHSLLSTLICLSILCCTVLN